MLTGFGAVALVGLWLGGYPGALILPLTSAAFLAVLALSGKSRLARLASTPWLVLLVLLAASAADAFGVHLRTAGHTGGLVVALANTTPQVLCLIAIGRLIAGLVMNRPGQEDDLPGSVGDL
jgi:hypothetical protein